MNESVCYSQRMRRGIWLYLNGEVGMLVEESQIRRVAFTSITWELEGCRFRTRSDFGDMQSDLVYRSDIKQYENSWKKKWIIR